MSADPLGASILRALDRARAARPAFAVPAERFADHVRAHAADASIVDQMHAEDLYLALACAAGEPPAIAVFEDEIGPEIARTLARLRLPSAHADDAAQRVRAKLFVADPGTPPKVLSYSGRGPLRAWLRALVVHEVMSDLRRPDRRVDSDSILTDRAADDDPELAHIKARYALPFREAFVEALGALTPRERNVLRLVYTDGLSVEQVASIYRVHRVSVSRWLGDVRKKLLDGTRAVLGERLHLDAAELASVTRLCLSQIDVSLDRLLASRI